MSEEQNRAAFEAWYKQNFHSQDDLYHKRGFENCWQAALSAKSVPDGYVLVPIEPTESMVKAMNNVIELPYNQANAKEMFKAKHTYKAMLAAAPPLQTDDDKVRELNQVFDNCRVIFFPKNGEYPIEHNPHANKISKDEILKAIASLSSGEQG